MYKINVKYYSIKKIVKYQVYIFQLTLIVLSVGVIRMPTAGNSFSLQFRPWSKVIPYVPHQSPLIKDLLLDTPPNSNFNG